MKNYNKSFIKFATFLLLLVLGCSKDRVTPLQAPILTVVPVEESKEGFLANPTNIFESLKETPTIKTIKDANDWPFVGKKGTKLYGNYYDFRFPDGAYADYPIEIQLTELFSPKDMILAEMPTVSDGRLLTTAGELNVRAFKNGFELSLTSFSRFRIQVPAPEQDFAMSLFYGDIIAGDVVNWKEAEFKRPNQDSSRVSSIGWFEQIYEIFPTQLGWINCDKFYNYPGDKTKIKFKSTLPEVTALKKFIYFPSIKSITQIYGDETLDLPVGEAVKVLCFAEKTDGKVFMQLKETVVTQDMILDISVVEISKLELMQTLAGL